MAATQTPTAPDRSVLRQLRRAGDSGRDGRGRDLTMPPILQYGFRPFFFIAALYAGVAIPVWLWMFHSGEAVPGPFAPLDWHVHEMLFGYLGAVIAGFILTAIPNWTGRLPLSGWPLAGLVALWLVGRIANAGVPSPVVATVIDMAFPAALAFAVWREVTAGRNWRNAPVAVMLTLFGVANLVHHADAAGWIAGGTGVRLALGVAAMLIALIGGRIVPSFTRNWLVKRGAAWLPASFGRLDKAALAGTAVAVIAWIAVPDATATGLLLLMAGTMLALRLGRWCGHRTLGEPIVWVLHAGYGWLALSVLLIGASVLGPAVPPSAALHALTAGAIGTMTLAVMTRASLGHTGRAIEADRWTVAIYVLVTCGAALRVSASFSGIYYLPLLMAGGGLWSAAFLLFALRYAPVLWRAQRAI